MNRGRRGEEMIRRTVTNRGRRVKETRKGAVMKRGRRILYMDESYINKNYCRHEDSMYDRNDEQDLTTIVHHKGQCYCFIAAIVDADHSVPEFERTDT